MNELWGVLGNNIREEDLELAISLEVYFGLYHT